MQESLWRWECSVRYSLPLPSPPEISIPATTSPETTRRETHLTNQDRPIFTLLTALLYGVWFIWGWFLLLLLLFSAVVCIPESYWFWPFRHCNDNIADDLLCYRSQLLLFFYHKLWFKMICTWRWLFCHRSLLFFVGICPTEAGLCSTPDAPPRQHCFVHGPI